MLLQGPTSSGKTSLVGFMAEFTGHKLVRINNHEHTDLQVRQAVPVALSPWCECARDHSHWGACLCSASLQSVAAPSIGLKWRARMQLWNGWPAIRGCA